MAKKNLKYGTVGFNTQSYPPLNQIVQKLPDDKKQTLYHELKSSGSIDNPAEYTEVHLRHINYKRFKHI